MAAKRSFIGRLGKILLIILCSVLILVALFVGFINTRPGKSFVKDQVVSYLERKLKTPVSIGAVDYSLPKWLELKDIYIEDQKRDTLLIGRELSVDLNMFKLIAGNTDIQRVYLNNVFIKLNRSEHDSAFNFGYIVDAFTGNKSSTKVKDTAEFKLTLEKLIFDTVSLRFNDSLSGSKFSAYIRNLNGSLNDFQPDKLNFDLNDFYANGVSFNMLSYKAPAPDTTVKVLTDSAKAEPTFGLYITANKFLLRDIKVDVHNSVTGMRYYNDISDIRLTNAMYNLAQSVIIADSAVMDSSQIGFVLGKKLPKTPAELRADSLKETPPLYVKASYLKIKGSQFKMENPEAKPVKGFDAAHIDIKDLNVETRGLLYSQDSTTAFIEQISLKDHSGLQVDSTHGDVFLTDKALYSNGLYLRTPRSLIETDFNILYDSLGAISKYPQKTQINAKLHNSVIAFNDIYMLAPALEKSLPPSAFGGLNLRVNTELRGNMQQVYIPTLSVSGLGGSRLNARGTLYNLSDPKRLAMDLYIISSELRKADLLRFVPPASRGALANLPDVFNLQGHLKGDLHKMMADVDLRSKGLNYKGVVVLNNIDNPAKLNYDLRFDQATFDRNFIAKYLTPQLRQQLELPPTIGLSGKFNGSSTGFDADVFLKTSYGNAKVKGYLQGFQNPNTAKYDLSLNTPSFDVGRLLKQDTSIGRISGLIKAKGTGFDPKTMNADIVARLNSIEYNRYAYQNVNADVQMRRGNVHAVGSVFDPNIKTDFDLALNLNRKYPSAIGYVNIDTVQLRPLGFTKDTLNLSTRLYVNARNTTPRQLDVDVHTDQLRFQSGLNRYVADSISLTGTSANGRDDITFRSPFAFFNINGAFDYDKIGTSMAQYLNKYYTIDPKLKNLRLPDQQAEFSAYVQKHPIITGLVPGLQDYDSIKLNGAYSTALGDSALQLNASIPYVLYNGNIVRNGLVDINSKNEHINYQVNFDTLFFGARRFFGTDIHGAAARDSVSFSAITQDNLATDWFGASADFYLAKDGNYNFRLKDNLLLNYEKWNVAPDNLISFGPRGYLVNNFRINSDTSIVEVHSKSPVYNSPIAVNIDNFNLASITSFVNADTLLVGGTLDAQLEASDFDKQLPAFTGTAQVSGLQVYKTPLGNLAAHFQKSSENTVTGDMSLNGFGNLINGKGNFYLNNPANQFDAELDIQKLNFLTLQGVSKGQLKDASGNIHGNMKLSGLLADPLWNGEIVFDSTRYTVTMLGAPHIINNQKIVFEHPFIRFNNFSITDSANHPLSINGSVKVEKLSNFAFDLNISADNFVAFNARRPIGQTISGLGMVDANVNVTGTGVTPNLQGYVRVNEKSDVTLYLPERNYSKDDGLNVVKFIDADTFNVYSPPKPFTEAKADKQNLAQFLNYNLNLDVSKEARLSIVIDPATGDKLITQGEALLNVGVDPGGNLVLGGTYVLEQGSYALSYQFLSRKFDLVKGSTINFSGSPLEAMVDISAVYHVNTDSKNLIGSQITEASTAMSGQLNQKVPFNVRLNISGVMSKPTIKFGIELVESETGAISSELRTSIQNKLAQLEDDEAAMNKQIFSLMLMGRFVNEQSTDFFAGGSGGGFDDLARQSVSQFLSEALDQIASDLVRGVDIDLTLNSYKDFSSQATGVQRTDLNVAVSKSFLNDRLTISVGQNFGIEGQDAVSKANAGNNSNSFNPNISAAYKLTSDGRYVLKAYRRNQFEVLLEGYVVETGLAFVVVMDYNKFGELFRKKK